MDKIERVNRALRGEEVDRPPFSFWYHFGLQHMPAARHAEAEVDFFRAYEIDFLKVMNDYPYPLPRGLESIEDESGWKALEPIRADDACWQQLEALSLINDAIGGQALFIDTIFSPWTTARRLARGGSITEARRRHPEALLSAMEVIAESLASYSKEAVARGASGIFLSIGAATHDLMTPEEYDVWGRPFDLKVLDAVREAPFNVLHIHGSNIHFDSLLDYPVSAINWSHYNTAPSLDEGRRRFNGAVMGGVNETAAAQLSPAEIAEQVSNAVKATGTRGLIVAPGCSVPTDTPVRNLKAIRSALEKGAV